MQMDTRIRNPLENKTKQSKLLFPMRQPGGRPKPKGKALTAGLRGGRGAVRGNPDSTRLLETKNTAEV